MGGPSKNKASGRKSGTTKGRSTKRRPAAKKARKKGRERATGPRDDAADRGGTPRPSSAEERRLDTILRALPEAELNGLIRRMEIRVDKKKRIDTPAQVARTLVRLPDLRDPSRLPQASADLVHRIAEVGGSMLVDMLPPGLEHLVRRGIVFARVAEGLVELVLPTAFLVQLKGWEGEDPRSLRALLSEAPAETMSAVASYYLGRPCTPPAALSLEVAWETIGAPERLLEEVERCSHQERRLLDQLEQVGGEVDTQELMDLEREPMRVRGAYGVAAGRRGAAFSLEKRGLLFPVHPNRYVLPSEVAAIIGAERHELRKRRRASIRSEVISEDYLPRRAQFSYAPAPLAIALTFALRQGSTEVKAGVGTPRSLIQRLASRFGSEVGTTTFIVALSRAAGLWDETLSASTPPGKLNLARLSRRLFDVWRRGGAWDEARADPELLRIAPDHRDPSPVGLVREMVLDALVDLGEGQWVPFEEMLLYLRDDPRAGGLSRLMNRWAGQLAIEAPDEWAVASRVLLQSLPALGVVDLGGRALDEDDIVDEASGDGLAMRLTARGKRFITGEALGDPDESVFDEQRRLRVGMAAQVVAVMALAPLADVLSVGKRLELELASGALSRGLAAGLSANEMRTLIDAVAPLPEELSAALDQAGAVVGRAMVTAAAGFLWVEEEDVRELLRTLPPASELFIDPSPAGGLLVAEGVTFDNLVRRCRALGVEVVWDEDAARLRRAGAPSGRGLGAGGSTAASGASKRRSSAPPRRSTIPPPVEGEKRRPVSWRPPQGPRKKSTGGN